MPQVTLQALLFFGVIQGGNLGDITDRDLILSICSAIFNSIIHLPFMSIVIVIVLRIINIMLLRTPFMGHRDLAVIKFLGLNGSIAMKMIVINLALAGRERGRMRQR